MKFDYSTRDQLNARLRALYAVSKGDVLAKLAVYFSARPSAELQSAFGISVGATKPSQLVGARSAAKCDCGIGRAEYYTGLIAITVSERIHSTKN